MTSLGVIGRRESGVILRGSENERSTHWERTWSSSGTGVRRRYAVNGVGDGVSSLQIVNAHEAISGSLFRVASLLVRGGRV